jgi:MFS family permease
MNLLIYLIGSSVGPVIAGIILQAHQITTNSSDSISTSYPSPESYSMIFLIATLISLSSMVFAILLNRKDSSQGRYLKDLDKYDGLELRSLPLIWQLDKLGLPSAPLETDSIVKKCSQ